MIFDNRFWCLKEENMKTLVVSNIGCCKEGRFCLGHCYFVLVIVIIAKMEEGCGFLVQVIK